MILENTLDQPQYSDPKTDRNVDQDKISSISNLAICCIEIIRLTFESTLFIGAYKRKMEANIEKVTLDIERVKAQNEWLESSIEELHTNQSRIHSNSKCA